MRPARVRADLPPGEDGAGFIRIKRERLACEVDSVKRAHKIRALIESALDEHARYRATEIQSMDLMSPDTEDAGCHAQALSPIGA